MANEKILIVEDEETTAMNMKQVLEKLGYNVLAIISSGEDAVEKAAEVRPDLVLMDILLEGEMDGIEAAQKILSIDIPVVYITLYADKETLELVSLKPPHGYLVKPIDDNRLQKVVEMALYKHKKERERIEGIKKDFLSKKRSKLRDFEEREFREGANILIVEDEAITALNIKHMLEDLGYVPAMASSGEEALKKAVELKPDLVLLDITLRGELDGIETSKNILELDIPVIFITARADKETFERAKITIPYGYLIKPFGEKELLSNIKTALHKHKSEKTKEKKFVDRVSSKERELKMEKLGVALISTGTLAFIIYGLINLDMTWLEYLLFIPAIYGIIITALSFKRPAPPKNPNFRPFVSIIIPAHNEENTIESCVQSLANLDYFIESDRNYEIIVINDGSSDNTRNVLIKMKKEYDFLKIVSRISPRAGKGKGYVLNDGLKMSDGEVIAVFDADAKVEPDFLNKAVPYLSDEDVAGVQTRVKMYNANKNLLTSMQNIEFAIFGNVILKAKDIMGGSASLGGNGQITLKKAIKKLEGWDGYAITEDLNMSVKLMIGGWKIRYCPETAVYQEAVKEWKPFFRQRVRWAMGNLETLFVYLVKILIARKVSIYRRLDAIQYLASLLFIAFVMLGYTVAILYVGFLIYFQFSAPIFISIISTIAFFPVVFIGIYRETGNFATSIGMSIEYWAYCLYLIPLFFVAFLKLIIRRERTWAKTHHTGE